MTAAKQKRNNQSRGVSSSVFLCLPPLIQALPLFLLSSSSAQRRDDFAHLPTISQHRIDYSFVFPLSRLTGSRFSTARKNPIGSTNNQREERSLIEVSPYLSRCAPVLSCAKRALPLFFLVNISRIRITVLFFIVSSNAIMV
jgi:hypothetical protein